MPRIEFSRLPPLFCLSFGAFLSLLVTAFVLEARSTQKQVELASNYGNALVRLVAMEASESVVSDDLLGLHALLADVVALPRVGFASVSDPDKVLLAQAGEEASPVYSKSFTAAVQLHDKVGAYVSIAMEVGFESDVTLRWVLVAIGALLLLMSGLAVYEARSEVFVAHQQASRARDGSPSAEVSEPVSSESLQATVNGEEASETSGQELEPQDQLSGESEGEEDGPNEHTSLKDSVDDHRLVDLIIALPNFTRLERQLSDIAFSRRVASFERMFRSVLPLYDGVEIQTPAAQGVYCLRFGAQDTDSATFMAVSAACLIQTLDQTQKIKFHYLAAVCREDSDVQLTDSDKGVFLHSSLLTQPINEKLVCGEVQKDYYPVEGLQGRYAELLQKQADKLQCD